MMPVSDRLRVVILNYGNAAATGACARAVLSQSYRPLDVVVVDNFSSDAVRDELRRILPAGVHLLCNPCNTGYAAGNNAGCRTTTLPRPEYFAILNNDVMLTDQECLRKLVDAFAEKEVVAVSPLVDTRSARLPSTEQAQVRRIPDYATCLVAYSWWLSRIPMLSRYYSRHIYESRFPWQRNSVYDCESINGSCFVVRADFLESIGYLDEGTFLYFEEVILGSQIRRRGRRCALVTAVSVEHYQGLATGQRGAVLRWSMYQHSMKSQLHYCRHHLGVGSLACLLLRMVRLIDYGSKLLVRGVLRVVRMGRVRVSEARPKLSDEKP